MRSLSDMIKLLNSVIELLPETPEMETRVWLKLVGKRRIIGTFLLAASLVCCRDPGSVGSAPLARDLHPSETVFALEEPAGLQRCFFVVRTSQRSIEFLHLNEAPVAKAEPNHTGPSDSQWIEMLWGSVGTTPQPPGPEIKASMAKVPTTQLIRDALQRLLQDGHIRETAGICPEVIKTFMNHDDSKDLALMAPKTRRLWMIHAVLCGMNALNSCGLELGEDMRQWKRLHRSGAASVERLFE